ncbi:MAG: Flp pilus assembly protein CpaB [Candidatus Rokuibacteriota bacterium]
MKKPGTILLMAVVLGALVSAWVYNLIRMRDREVEAARRAAAGDTIELVVAASEIPIGARIEAGQVRTTRWPIDAEPEGAIKKPEEVIGQIARMTIEKHRPVVGSQLVREGVGLLPMLITEGMRAMSVKVDSVTGVSGFITPNSRVDVLVAGRPDGRGDDEERSKLILQNVRVLATGKSIEQQDEKPVEVPNVTLLVTPEEAEKLTLATRQEPVRLALRNFRDEEVVRTSGMSTSALFANAVPTVVTKTNTGVVRRAPAPDYSVEVFLGDKSTRQSLKF